MVNKDWMTPYNTGKVLIGCLYTPKFVPHPMTQDGLILQRALLKTHKPKARVTGISLPKPTRSVARLKNLVRVLTKWRVK